MHNAGMLQKSDLGNRKRQGAGTAEDWMLWPKANNEVTVQLHKAFFFFFAWSYIWK